MTALYPQAIGVEPITRFTLALASAAEGTQLDARVPACDGWTVADLVWHMTEVQDFWIYIIANRPKGPQNYDRPPRPDDNRLVANLRNAVAGLTSVLSDAQPADVAWSWADEQTVGFSLRRQTHEALTHCIDALLAADLPLIDIDPELAADGIDEVVHLMINDAHATAAGTITLLTIDTDDSWTVRIGNGDTTVTGKAVDINLWLWGRANTWPLSVTGAAEQLNALRAAVTQFDHRWQDAHRPIDQLLIGQACQVGAVRSQPSYGLPVSHQLRPFGRREHKLHVGVGKGCR